MKNVYRILFCCLNSKKSKDIEYILLLVNFLCFIFYLIFFSTVSWAFIHILYKFLFYLNLIFLIFSIALIIYFIYLRSKRLINSKLNNMALSLAILIVLISIITIIINVSSTYNIFAQFIKLNEKKIIFYKSKTDNILSIISIIIINLIWLLICFLWIIDLIRIKLKINDSLYNYLKINSFRKNAYLFKEEFNKISKEHLQNEENNNGIIKKKNKVNEQSKFSVNKYFGNNNDNNSNIKENNNSINLNINNSINLNKSNASSSLNDSYQKPVNMIIIGTDEKGFPIYEKQASFDRSHVSNDSESFSNRDKKFDESNYIKYNNVTLNGLNAEDTIHDIESTNLEKNHILEKENDDNEDIKPKIVEKINPNENDNENENNDYKDHFVPLKNSENEKDNDNKENYDQNSKINE